MTGFTAADFDNICAQIEKVYYPEPPTVWVGIRLAWEIGGRRYKFRVKRSRGKVRLVRVRYIPELPPNIIVARH